MSMKPWKKVAVSTLLLILLALLASCRPSSAPLDTADFGAQPFRTAQAQVDRLPLPSAAERIPVEGIFTSREDVSLYLHTFCRLPGNFITKARARYLGWTGGDLRPYADNTCIGGDRFGNYERILPSERGRIYFECDIDTLGRDSRGSKRIVYSNDGMIYYTENHYESFTLLYTEDGYAEN